MIADTNMGWDEPRLYRAGKLTFVNGGGDDRLDAIGERLRILNGRRLDRRHLNRIADDQRDVGRLGSQASLRHHGASADYRDGNDWQSGFDGEQEASGFEARHVSVRAPR